MDSKDDDEYFLPYEESDEIVGTYQEDFEEIINYWKLRCIGNPKP